LSAKWSTLLASALGISGPSTTKLSQSLPTRSCVADLGQSFLLVLKSDTAVTITINDLPAKRRL
jgi:hypothetical protein